MSTIKQTIKHIAKDFPSFASRGGGINLYPYQIAPAEQVINSVLNDMGLTIVIIIARQGGKDEDIVNLCAFLNNLFAHREREIVITNPTYKPQTEKMLLRFENRLSTNLITRMFWKKRRDFMRAIGLSITNFLSADGKANVVGATASLLLVINEAQDTDISVYDKKFAPMTASTNATQIIAGTTWTSNTLLARELRAAKALEKKDGMRRVFIYTADDIRKVNPAYGKFVDKEVKKLGRQHPLIKTQYFCEEIDAITGMFNTQRLALMQGDSPAHEEPTQGHIYAFLIDVAGVDEAVLKLDGLGNPGRDKTTLSIVDVDLSNLEVLQAPIYRTVKRDNWQGQNHVQIFGALCAYIDNWHPLYIVIDATGVGEGLFSMLFNKYPTRVIPVKFTQQKKSELGYGFLGAIDSGRYRDCAQTEEVRTQYENCTSEILIGPAKTMRWGVKDGTRDTKGQLIHDDFIVADSLIAELDKLEWYVPSETTIIDPEQDVLEEMAGNY